MSTTGRVAEGTPLCEECGVSPGVWRCGDGSCEPATGCNQLLCHACDEWIHAAGTLKSHTRTPVCSRCDRCGTGAVLACATCELRFCRSCSLRLHAKGTRAQHRISDLPPAPAQDGRVQEVNSSPASNPVVPTVAAPAAAVDASSSSSSPSVQVAAAAPAAAPAAAAVAAPTVPTAASDIGKPRCTFLDTGKKFTRQWYTPCLTCDPRGGFGICRSCGQSGCHDGHRFGPAAFGSFYCDCGSDPLNKTRCRCNTPIRPTAAVVESAPTAVVGDAADSEEAAAALVVASSSFACPVSSSHPHSGARHPHVLCDGCRSAITGHRYQCLNCNDFDLCGACYDARLTTHHSRLEQVGHVFLLLPRPPIERPDRPRPADVTQLMDRTLIAATKASFRENPTLNETRVVHTGITCRLCSMTPIIGGRYRCMCCPELDANHRTYDLCTACYTSSMTAVMNQQHVPVSSGPGPHFAHFSTHIFAHLTFPISADAPTLRTMSQTIWPLTMLEHVAAVQAKLAADPISAQLQGFADAPTMHAEETEEEGEVKQPPPTPQQEQKEVSVYQYGGSDSSAYSYSSMPPGAPSLSSVPSASSDASDESSAYGSYSGYRYGAYAPSVQSLSLDGSVEQKESSVEYGQYAVCIPGHNDVVPGEAAEGASYSLPAEGSAASESSLPATAVVEDAASSAAASKSPAPPGGPGISVYASDAEAYAGSYDYAAARVSAANVAICGEDSHEYAEPAVPQPMAGLHSRGASIAPDVGAAASSPLSVAVSSPPPRDWNEEYQRLIESYHSVDARLASSGAHEGALGGAPSSEVIALRQEKFSLELALDRLQSEFAAFASSVARVIIAELHLPAALKTYRAASDVGGIAGGEKYIVGSLFFKFALDLKQLYGADEFAMKSAACELKGVDAYKKLRLPRLCSPLVRLVDYLGYRIVVSSLLPLGRRDGASIVYGSDNQCTTVHTDHPHCNQLMAQAGERLNLKAHVVGAGAQAKMIYGPGDIEVHAGTDERYYVIDAARVSPPEAPRSLIPAILLHADSLLKDDRGSSSDRSSALTILELNRASVLNESQSILLTRLKDQVRDLLKQFGVRAVEGDAHPLATLSNVRCAAMQVAGVMVVYQDLTRAQRRSPFVVLNRRASLLTQRRMYGDCIVIPGFTGTHLYHLLRMEFVESYRGPVVQSGGTSQTGMQLAPRTPLSSDAFTFFGRHDAARHNAEVRQATSHLLSVRITDLARLMIGLEVTDATVVATGHSLRSIGPITHSSELIRVMHAHGINCRFLGKLRSVISTINDAKNESNSSQQIASLNQTRTRLVEFILTEMIARVFKNSIRSKMRGLERPAAVCSAEVARDPVAIVAWRRERDEELTRDMKHLIVREFNYIFGPHTMKSAAGRPRAGAPSPPPSTVDGHLWNDTLKTLIQLKFGLHTPALRPEELESTYDLGDHMIRLTLMHHLCDSLGLRLTTAAISRFQEGDHAFLGSATPFSVEDIRDIDTEVNGHDTHQDGDRRKLIEETKQHVFALEADREDSPPQATPPQADSFYAAINTVLEWFHFPARTPSTTYLLLEPTIGAMMQQQLRVEARLVDQLIQQFGLRRSRASSSCEGSTDDPIQAVSVAPPTNFAPPRADSTPPPAAHYRELRSSLVELARLVSRLADEQQRRDNKIKIKEGRQEEQVAESCRFLAVQLIHRALALHLDDRAPVVPMLELSDAGRDAAAATAAAAALPSSEGGASPFAESVVPIEIVLKSYLVLAAVSEQRRDFVRAIQILKETLRVATQCFGWKSLDADRPANTTSSLVHPFFMSVLHQLVVTLRRANLHGYDAAYAHEWSDVARNFPITIFVMELNRLHRDGSSATRLPLQMNHVLVRNLMRAAFGVDVPVTYHALHEANSSNDSRFSDVFRTLTPFEWHNHLPIVTRTMHLAPPTPNEEEVRSLANWVEAVHFQYAADVTFTRRSDHERVTATISLPHYGGTQVHLRPDLIALVPMIDLDTRTRLAAPCEPVSGATNGRLYAWSRQLVPYELGVDYPSDLDDGPPHHPAAAAQAADGHTVVVATNNGSVYATGFLAPKMGINGSFSRFRQNESLPLPPLMFSSSLTGRRIVSIAIGAEHLLLVSDTGMAFSAGRGTQGALGLGDEEDRDTPRLIESLQNLPTGAAFIVEARADGRTSMLRSSTGAVFAFGSNQNEQMGIIVRDDSVLSARGSSNASASLGTTRFTTPRFLTTPTRVNLPVPIASFDLCSSYSMFVSTSGILYRCGRFHWLHTSNDEPSASNTSLPCVVSAVGREDESVDPEEEDAIPRAQEIAPFDAAASASMVPVRFTCVRTANYHCLMLSSTGRVYVMGRGANGGHVPRALGTGRRHDHDLPTLVSSLSQTTIASISVGPDMCFAVSESGRVFAWGMGSFGALNDPPTEWTKEERAALSRPFGNSHTRFRVFPTEMRFPSGVREIIKANEDGLAIASTTTDEVRRSDLSAWPTHHRLASAHSVALRRSSAPFSELLNISLTQRVYLASQFATSSPDAPPTSWRPITLVWDLPYVPVHDSFRVWRRNSDEEDIWAIMRDEKRSPCVTLALHSHLRAHSPTPYARAEADRPLEACGEVYLADLPVGRYCGVWRLGGQCRRTRAQALVTCNFEVRP